MARTEHTSLLNARLLTPIDVVRFVRAALGPWYRSRTAVVVLGLDSAGTVRGPGREPTTVDAEEPQGARDGRTRGGAPPRRLILVQLVPGLRREPALAEAQSFRGLAARCASEGVRLLDCVVVSGDRWWSLAQVLAERAARN